jgi:DNA helicase-2/ATP-dependent DNA helicase PcrA
MASFAALMPGWRRRRTWEGQVRAVREWFEPHLEAHLRSGAGAAGDLMQLERIAQQFATARALSDRARARSTAGDERLAVPPLLDEDFLILSTVHSAKARKWDSVYVLNIVDGNFPSDFHHRPRS